jgi:hypothetical protein
MNTSIPRLVLAGLFALSAGAASAGVTVTYDHPEKFSDLPWNASDRQTVLQDLTAHFDKLAAMLAPGTDLKVEVLDVDLAGRVHYSPHRSTDIRVLNGGADWPHMHLRYTIERDGKVVASGEDQLNNMAYLERNNRYSTGDNLRYEKQMIDDWFKDKLAGGQVAAR